MKRHFAFAIALICASISMPRIVAATACEIAPGACIVIPGNLPDPVRLAAADLQRDLKKILGADSPIVEKNGGTRRRSAIIIAAPEDFSDTLSSLGIEASQLAGPEAHAVLTREIDGTRHVVLAGRDMRGLIYAIYSFSEECLGVPPLWYWCGWKPGPQKTISLPADFRRLYPAASVRWRGWFNNDTDFLSPWRRATPANDDAIYETILRLKYNTYEVGAIADLRPAAPRYAVISDVRGASRRGLIITSHHAAPVGSSYGSGLKSWNAFWQREQKSGRDTRTTPPALRIADTASLEAFWRYHIETAVLARIEMLWTIAFRGDGDKAFWATFPDSPKDMAARATIIERMLRKQIALIKEITGDPAPPMHNTLYNENCTLVADGLLKLPEEPSLIWTFVAARRDHFPAADIRTARIPQKQPVGYYLNFQFTSTGAHLAAAEGFWKMAANYRTVAELAPAKRIAFTVVNAGNIREHVAELSANAAMMWHFEKFSPDAFLSDFCARYFTPQHAPEIARLCRDYYDAYWRQKQSDLPAFPRQYIFQDQRYSRAADMLLKAMAQNTRRPNPLDGHPMENPDTGSPGYFRVEPGPGDKTQLDALLRGTAESAAAFRDAGVRADELLAKLPDERRRFFDDILRTPAHVMAQLNTMLHEIAAAYALPPGQRAQIHAHLKSAQTAGKNVRELLAATDTGVFADWHKNDEKFKLNALIGTLEKTAQHFK